MKRLLAFIILSALTFGMIGCANSEPPVDINTGTATVKWLDFSEMSWDDVIKLELPEFPGATFIGSALEVSIADQNGERSLFDGLPIWNVYLADITGDGLSDFVATISFGSGIIDTRVLVYDIANDILYGLSDRAVFDYELEEDDGRLVVIRTAWGGGDRQIGELSIIDGRLTMVHR